MHGADAAARRRTDHEQPAGVGERRPEGRAAEPRRRIERPEHDAEADVEEIHLGDLGDGEGRAVHRHRGAEAARVAVAGPDEADLGAGTRVEQVHADRLRCGERDRAPPDERRRQYAAPVRVGDRERADEVAAHRVVEAGAARAADHDVLADAHGDRAEAAEALHRPAGVAVEDGDGAAEAVGFVPRCDPDERVRADRAERELPPRVGADLDGEVVDQVAGRRVEDVRVRVGRAGAVEVRGADQQAVADREERLSEVAAVLGDREPADRTEQRGVGGVDGARRNREMEDRDERGEESPAPVAGGRGGVGPQCFSLATASFISGTALKRSATRP